MTTISHLSISNVRNIAGINLDPCEKINLIHGPNGSGKTSILEAIHLLAVGRSFRSIKVSPLIKYDSNECTVFARLENSGRLDVGVQKSRNQKALLKLQGRKQPNWLEVARLVPVQIIDSNAFRLLEGSPKDRRKFLDWGVFHVEPSFVEHWRNSRKCIANRNLLLKAGVPDRAELRAWNTELCKEAELVDLARKSYFDEFSPIFLDVVSKIDALDDISLHYKRGWDADTNLSSVLERSERADMKYGSTQNGPHRADIVVKKGANFAYDVLSRGQQKMLVSALKLAQGEYQARNENRKCIFLIDDLPAELDEANRGVICEFLQSLGSQIFMTCVDEGTMDKSLERASLIAKFHVEHGKIRD